MTKGKFGRRRLARSGAAPVAPPVAPATATTPVVTAPSAETLRQKKLRISVLKGNMAFWAIIGGLYLLYRIDCVRIVVEWAIVAFVYGLVIYLFWSKGNKRGAVVIALSPLLLFLMPYWWWAGLINLFIAITLGIYHLVNHLNSP